MLSLPSTEYEIELDELAIGLTRPPMIWGVMLPVVVVNMLLCTLSYVYLKSFYVCPFFVAFHWIAMRFSIKEPRFLMLYFKYFQKTPPVLNTPYWGCNSYDYW